MLCLSHYAACGVKPDYTLSFEAATLGLVNILFYLFFIQMRLNFTTQLQMVIGPVFVGDEVLAS